MTSRIEFGKPWNCCCPAAKARWAGPPRTIVGSSTLCSGFCAPAHLGETYPRTMATGKTPIARYSRWQDQGVWGQLLAAVIDDPDFEWLLIDASHRRHGTNSGRLAAAAAKPGDLLPRLLGGTVEPGQRGTTQRRDRGRMPGFVLKNASSTGTSGCETGCIATRITSWSIKRRIST